jgi:purine-nucleoside phosphorylase
MTKAAKTVKKIAGEAPIAAALVLGSGLSAVMAATS